MSLNSLGDEKFDFDELADLYQAHGAINPPSELHGLWCGKISGCARLTDAQVISIALEHMGVDFLQDKESESLLLEIFQRLEKKLVATDMSFKPLLPDDEFALSERVEALSQWVRGFLEGIALQVGSQLMELGDEVREILQDLVEVSQLDAEVDDDDAGESEFIEVLEHVRMSVLSLFYTFLDGNAATDSLPPTIH
ncbi:MAG: UPF0149 family protein [Hahellaceae bacterium]|nr:UPF0149 family protein [Hahellaceae bacterium]